MYVRAKLAVPKQPELSFKPDFIAETVAEIDFDFLTHQGVKACFIDLDDTVVERNKFKVSPFTVKRLRSQKLSVYIATNRPRSRELKNLKEKLYARAVIHPHGIFGKPTKRYYQRALKENGLSANEVVMIGDRYLQDIMGANRTGLYSLVVNKIGAPSSRYDAMLSRFESRLTRSLFASYKQT